MKVPLLIRIALKLCGYKITELSIINPNMMMASEPLIVIGKKRG